MAGSMRSLFGIARPLRSGAFQRSSARFFGSQAAPVQAAAAPSTTPSVAGEFDVVIVGAGAAGASVSAQLLKAGKGLKVAVIDPSELHFYQPGFTLVGSGQNVMADCVKKTKDILHPEATWVQKSVTSFDPENNQVLTKDGERIRYKNLVVAAGLQTNWNTIPGLTEGLADTHVTGVCSIYSNEYAPETWDRIWSMNNGHAIFTAPSGPVKCAGAPLKIAFLADDYWRNMTKRQQFWLSFLPKPAVTFQPSWRYYINMSFMTGNPTVFGQPDYALKLKNYLYDHAIDVRTSTELVEVLPNRTAVFKHTAGPKAGEQFVEAFRLLHVTPPMSSPDFIKNSPLADAAGFVDVDKETLRHTKFSNVWSIGDCSSLPTSKTAAAIFAASPTLVKNMLSAMDNKPLTEKYDGYTSCPIFTSYHTLMLAEFSGAGYGLKKMESSVFDQGQPSIIMNKFVKYCMPALYDLGLKGEWYGPHSVPARPFFQKLKAAKEWMEVGGGH